MRVTKDETSKMFYQNGFYVSMKKQNGVLLVMIHGGAKTHDEFLLDKEKTSFTFFSFKGKL